MLIHIAEIIRNQGIYSVFEILFKLIQDFLGLRGHDSVESGKDSRGFLGVDLLGVLHSQAKEHAAVDVLVCQDFRLGFCKNSLYEFDRASFKFRF